MRINQPACSLMQSSLSYLTELFCDIIACAVTNNEVLKTLHAPVWGIVSEIHIVDDYIIGKVDQGYDSSQVIIWKTDPIYLLSKIETNQDKLTKSVK